MSLTPARHTLSTLPRETVFLPGEPPRLDVGTRVHNLDVHTYRLLISLHVLAHEKRETADTDLRASGLGMVSTESVTRGPHGARGRPRRREGGGAPGQRRGYRSPAERPRCASPKPREPLRATQGGRAPERESPGSPRRGDRPPAETAPPGAARGRQRGTRLRLRLTRPFKDIWRLQGPQLVRSRVPGKVDRELW